MSILYVMVGPPASGKSTWARNHCGKNTFIVSRDAIRFSLLQPDDNYFVYEKEVWWQYVSSITNLLLEGKDVIADATHNDTVSRRKLFRALKDVPCDIIPIVMDTSMDTCLGRNANREGRAKVPSHVIHSFFEAYEYPDKSEDPRIIAIYCHRGDRNE